MITPPQSNAPKSHENGGGREIRTLGTIARTTVFEFGKRDGVLCRVVHSVLIHLGIAVLGWCLVLGSISMASEVRLQIG